MMKTDRDMLGWTCFLIHIAVLVIVISGWAVPDRAWLIFYLIFLPAMFLHWKLNRDACILSNLENWLRRRRWRMPQSNREEGAWLRTLLADATGIALTSARMNAVIYGAIALFWVLAAIHVSGRF
jgi:hypothetical protein